MPKIVWQKCLHCKQVFSTTRARIKNGRGKFDSQECVKRWLSDKYKKDQRRRFEAKIKKTAGCWEWTGATDTRGYGSLTLQKKRRQAHRVSYEFYVGAIPSGMKVLHRCDNPGCVRPGHLWVGTQKDNIQDAMRKGRMSSVRAVGEAHYRTKLTARKVKVIRASKRPAKALAQHHGVSLPTIYAIRVRRIWKSIP